MVALHVAHRTAWRTVITISTRGYPCVRYGGWGCFFVRPDEVIEVQPKEQPATKS